MPSLRRLQLLLLLILTLPVRAMADQPPAIVLVLPSIKQHAGLLATTEDEVTRSKGYRVILLATLYPLMRQSDEEKQVRSRVAALVEEGRQALVTLEHSLAKTKLSGALELLEGSYIRHYDPRVLAQVRVLLGVIELHMARPDLARQELVAAHHLDPTYTLDAHYSPQVRAAFKEAGQNLPPYPAPSIKELKRIVALARSKVALVLSVEPAGERDLYKGAIYLDEQSAYTAVESRLVNSAVPEVVVLAARSLGKQMRTLIEVTFPEPAVPLIVVQKKKKKKVAPPIPPSGPWYLKWYTLAAVGTAVAAAIIIPLAVQNEKVGLTVRW